MTTPLLPPAVPTATSSSAGVLPEAAYAQQTLARLPLAESVLLLWQQIADPAFLQGLFDRHRGRCYDKLLSFPHLVQLIADALLQHDGSARASFEHALQDDALEVTIPAAYGKLRRLPVAVSIALLTAGTARLRPLVPPRPAAVIPPRLQGFTVTVLDGKAIKRVAKRLKLLRGTRGGLLGGKALVALELNTGLAVALQADPDGESNEVRLVPALLPAVRQGRPGPRLWLADRQFCDLVQAAAFTAEGGDHFLVRYHSKVQFCPDPARPVRREQDSQGRSYEEEWGWLGCEANKARRPVRRVRLRRDGAEDIILVTDLGDAARYPAEDLLELYLARWGIERVFQQVTEVFSLKRLIGGTPQAGIFQLSFCLLLYNMIQVMRTQVAAAEGWQPEDISLEKLFTDVGRELTAWGVLVTPAATVAALGEAPSGAELQRRLGALLSAVWQDRWLKAVNEKPRPHQARHRAARTHTSVHRVLEDHRRQQRAKHPLTP